jgi:hypothetical protein
VLRLFAAAECISLEHANPNNQAANNKARDDKPPAGPLSDEIHPPPTILNIDLVRMLERHLRDLNPKTQEEKPQPASSAGAAAAADKAEGAAQPGTPSERGRRCPGGVPDIGPARTMHLQMMPMVSGLSQGVCKGLQGSRDCGGVLCRLQWLLLAE